MFEAAVRAASASERLIAALPSPSRGRTVVVGAGKAAAAMARAVEDAWKGEIEGLVVTRYGHGVPTKRIEVVEASHPNPDEAGQRAAARPSFLCMISSTKTKALSNCFLAPTTPGSR